jgi:hypothetical protein
LSQAGNLSADPFLDHRRIERTLVDQRKQQRNCTRLGIHSESTENVSGFSAAVDRVVRAFIRGKLTSD